MNTTSSTGTGIKNKYGDEIHFEFTKASEEQQKMIRETIKELADKYESELIEVVDGASGFGKNRSSMNIGGIMTIASNAKKTTIIHEFGHSLAMTSAEKKGFQNNPAFWKELRKVHREYKEDVHRYGNREYALDEGGYADDIDEFLAEGFEAAILNANNLNEKYPKKIIAIVDKYFKKK
jgi:intracellular sulfur oxidation DsrE/DsrF family protein